jgi:NitT/TauT family transport system ATP-binding protein
MNTFKPALELHSVSKTFHEAGLTLPVIDQVSLSLEPREFLSLVGPSGCGKTTLLRIIAGLEKPTEGNAFVDGHKVEGPGPDRGMVFQDFTSFPWLTVAQNITFGLRLRDAQRANIEEAEEQWISLTGLNGFEDFYPDDLSGGMQQRVALARALANRPTLILMDEPFGSLDALTRWEMQLMLAELRINTALTGIFVTHDVGEAIFLGDRVGVLSHRPAQIKKIFGVPFPLPRARELFASPDFLELELEILSLMRE